MRLDPIRPTLKARGTNLLRLYIMSWTAFNRYFTVNLRRYTLDTTPRRRLRRGRTATMSRCGLNPKP